MQTAVRDGDASLTIGREGASSGFTRLVYVLPKMPIPGCTAA